MRLRQLAPFVLSLILGAAGCGPPKYVSYKSIHGDWKTTVPWGWNVITDDENTTYSATTFLGPFDPDFFLGIPSFSVRWHANGVPHQLRGGSAEIYSDADDYIRQTIRDVYGQNSKVTQTELVTRENRKVKQIIVESPVEVPKTSRWGVSEDQATKKIYNFRHHVYVVLPLEHGFYVLVYPATKDGYKLYEKQFNAFTASFVVLTEGPSGPKAEPAKPSFATKDKGKS